MLFLRVFAHKRYVEKGRQQDEDRNGRFVAALQSKSGDRAFYRMVLALVLPVIVQNSVTNFVNLLDNRHGGPSRYGHLSELPSLTNCSSCLT